MWSFMNWWIRTLYRPDAYPMPNQHGQSAKNLVEKCWSRTSDNTEQNAGKPTSTRTVTYHTTYWHWCKKTINQGSQSAWQIGCPLYEVGVKLKGSGQCGLGWCLCKSDISMNVWSLIYAIQYVGWLGGVVVMASDLWSRDCKFDSRLVQCRAA